MTNTNSRSIIVGIVCSVLTPYMLNPGAWNWQNYAGFFWGGICFLCIIYTYFRVPEPTGRSFAELDVLFEQGVSARKFKSTQVDVYSRKMNADVLRNYKEHTDVDHVERRSAGEP